MATPTLELQTRAGATPQYGDAPLFEHARVDTRVGVPIFPPLTRLREVSLAVARAVAGELVRSGAAPPLSSLQIDQRLREAMWSPEYLPYRPADRVEVG